MLGLAALVVFIVAIFVPTVGPVSLLLVGLALLAAHVTFAIPLAIRRA